MSKVNLAISGCMGRMGQQLVKSSSVDKNFKLTTLTENRLVKKKISGIKPSLNNENSFKNRQILSNAQKYFWKIHQMGCFERSYF